MHDAYGHADPAAGLVTKLNIPATSLPAPIAIPAASVSHVVAGAVAGAAIAVLKSQWKRQSSFIDSQLAHSPDDKSNRFFQYGMDLGHAVGVAMINMRETPQPNGLFKDNSNARDDMTFSGQHGRHQPDPFSPGQGRLSTRWGNVEPFCIPKPAAGMPIHNTYIADYPPLGTPRYNAAVADVKALGGRNSSTRNPNETVAGIYWGYDGPRGLGVPPRLYNQVVRTFVEQNGGNTAAENAKLFAMINVGMADAAIVAWSAKYHAEYDLWRPVVGIRSHDNGFGKGHGSHPNLFAPTAPASAWQRRDPAHARCRIAGSGAA